MPEQLLHAAGMALPMMLAAVCNYLGLSPVDLSEEIDKHTATLRRALKDNLGVTSPGHPTETKKEFVERIRRAVHGLLPALNGRSPKQQELADRLNWDASYLRARQRKHRIKNHEELLRLIGIRKRPQTRAIKSSGK
ncbi:MAG TPA: hypothetical protein VJU86_14145 [Pyrinomonadaceae bacterium]|nr:hypothetical protein [Pyrinomonadaceae bacterium]